MLVIITDGNAGVGDDLYSKLSANSNLLTDHQFIFVFVIEMWAYQGQWSLTVLTGLLDGAVSCESDVEIKRWRQVS